ncbi:CRISPR-associated endonuclease Cas2 [Thermodesulfovibrio hydrogeniphilus]
MSKTFYIIAYDISDHQRLAKVSNFLKGYRIGGQKSVYECFLTEGELKFVTSKLRRLIHPGFDRIHVFVMDKRLKPHTLGLALPPKLPNYFYIG